MRSKLAIIHTTPLTVEPLKGLAAEMIPDATVMNWVDDSILPQLASNGGNIGAIEERLTAYARFAEEAGADVILHACSSVGGLVERVQAAVRVPVIRIDEAMAEEAIKRGPRIVVAATLATTLRPTLELLRQKAEEAGKTVDVTPLHVDSAYQKLLSGDREAHDSLLTEALLSASARADVVVLAQASMARVLPNLPEQSQNKFLSSPRLAMAQVRMALRD